MSRSREVDIVSALVEQALPDDVEVNIVTAVHSQKPTSLFRVELTDGKILLLHLSSSPGKLLRSERWLIRSEIAVIEWLTKGDPPQPTEGSFKRECPSPDLRVWHSVETPIRNYLPTLIRHSSSPTELGPAHSLFEPVLGEPIAWLKSPPTGAERENLDFQKGCLLRHLTYFISPNSQFGLAAVVLGPSLALEGAKEEARDSSMDLDGMDSWRKTFHLLLEGILRDGEDLAVTISYELVRSTFRKFGHLLDAVTTPRLVAYDTDDDEVVLVTRSQDREDPQPENDVGKREDTIIKPDPDDSPTNTDGGSRENPKRDDPTIKITGLRHWSNCIFGDPLFAPVFSRSSLAFERGFRAAQDRSHVEDGEDREAEEPSVGRERKQKIEVNEEGEKEYAERKENNDVIEDPENARTRILLYECYHATVSIVTQFYRPDANSSQREIAARRRLVAALNKLSQVDVGETVGKRLRRPSQQDSPAKRSRGDTATPIPTPKHDSKPTAT
jgi:hypothetical protein